MVDRGEFLEWAGSTEALRHSAGGLSKSMLGRQGRGSGHWMSRGAPQVKSKIKNAIAIFHLPPSFAELERRLKARRLEPDDVIRAPARDRQERDHLYREYDTS